MMAVPSSLALCCFLNSPQPLNAIDTAITKTEEVNFIAKNLEEPKVVKIMLISNINLMVLLSLNMYFYDYQNLIFMLKVKVNNKKEHVIEMESASSGTIDNKAFSWDVIEV